ncbi:MAG: hypothetical protein JWM85_3572 [Acidimicrobiaceae bacterium]|nr:hypothetical protein [Acidimicrobiaceae bacterium]
MASASILLSPVRSHRRTWRAAIGLVLGLLGLTTVGPIDMTAGSAAGSTPAAAPLPAHWVPYRHLLGVVDIAGPRGDGSFSVAAAGKLFLLDRSGLVRPIARGRSGYSTAQGPEPYITVADEGGNTGSGCSFPSDTTFAIEPSRSPGVIAVDGNGKARRFANLPRGARPNGISFDTVGRFGHRLLVTSAHQGGTTVFGVDCRGTLSTITTHAPVIEGGMVVAPTSFGSFGGDLIAPDEGSGRIFAVAPSGRTTLVARSLLPSGPDIGVESAGFVPNSFGRRGMAFLADRFSRGNAHPGTDNLLRLPGSELIKAGVRPGDLLVASEGGAQTIVVRCSKTCTVQHIADGPAIAHAEGHIAFATG